MNGNSARARASWPRRSGALMCMVCSLRVVVRGVGARSGQEQDLAGEDEVRVRDVVDRCELVGGGAELQADPEQGVAGLDDVGRSLDRRLAGRTEEELV